MSGPLQEFHFEKSEYQRPNQDWVCGLIQHGETCPLGPTPGGKCESTAECSPHRDGDRWVCARASWRGGKCADGPLPNGSCACPIVPCQPRRSVRTRRRVLTLAAVGLTLGLLLLTIRGPINGPQAAVINPGELTLPHHSHDCKQCHAAANGSLGAWVEAPWEATANSDPHTSQSEKCQQCHKFGDFPLDAHSQDPRALARVTDQFLEQPNSGAPLGLMAARAVPGTAAHETQLVCATCHQEHRGHRHDLRQMSDEQCQSCHARPFQSFVDGHPEFEHYPYVRRTRIYFNHATHYGRHFELFERLMPGGKAPKSCSACHLPGTSGKMVRMRGFEDSCASCHARQIEDNVLPGLNVLALPNVDVATLKEKGHDVGEWPSARGKTLEGAVRVPPYMDVLLSADDSYVEAKRILEGVALANLAEVSDAQLKAADNYVWAVKRLLFELARNDQRAAEQRLKRALGAAIVPGTIADLVGGIAENTVRDAQAAWLPKLPAEMAARAASKWPPDRSKEEGEEQPEGAAAPDNEAAPPDAPSGTAANPPQSDPPQSDPASGASSPAAVASQAMLGVGWYRDDSDFSIRFHARAHADPFLRQWIDLTAAVTKGSEDGPLSHASLKALHTTLADWIGSKAEVTEADVHEKGSAFPLASLRALYSTLADQAGEGRCMTCHTIDVNPEARSKTLDPLAGMLPSLGTAQRVQVNWYAEQPVANLRRVTRFSHAPHVRIVGDEGCVHCHQLNDDWRAWSFDMPAFLNRNGSVNTNPHQFDTSGLFPMQGKQCAECHSSRAIGDGCVTCHNYHVGTFRPVGWISDRQRRGSAWRRQFDGE